MAKTLAMLASLLFLIVTVICVPAKERVPSLEIIQREDAEEGIRYPAEERVQNGIKTTYDKSEDRSGRSSPSEAENLQPEINPNENEISILDNESELETNEYIPGEDLENTIFEYNFDETENVETISSNIEESALDPTNSEIDENKIEEEEFITEDEETEETEPEQEFPYNEEEEEITEDFDEEDNVDINESENSLVEGSMYQEEEIEGDNVEIPEEPIENEEEEEEYDNTGDSNTEESEEESMEENNAEEKNDDESVEETFGVDNEEKALEGENEEEVLDGENVEESHEGLHDEEASDVEIEAGKEENNEDESDSYESAWFEEGLQNEEDEDEEEYLTLSEDGSKIKSPGLIYNAIAELTKYDEENDNNEVFDNSISQMVEPPEDFNTVQTYPVQASDEPIVTEEDAVCSLPAVSGQCKAYFQRYFFNSKTGECELFVYGGCGGNGNNFETLHDCQVKCVRRDNL